MFRKCKKMYGKMVVVKGCEWEVDMVKEENIFVIKKISHYIHDIDV
jgi:hypothetical protein